MGNTMSNTLNGIKNWWNRREIEQANKFEEFQRQVEALRAEHYEVRQQNDAIKSELAVVEAELAAANEILDADAAKRTSTEPWVEIKSERLDPVKGMVIELDWNEAFIQHLADNGITGRDEDTVVQKWIAMLYSQLMDSLEFSSIERTDVHGSPKDYE